MPKPVLTKKDFVRRYSEGEFGNASPTWNNLHHFLDTGKHFYKDPVHIRNRIPGGKTWYDVDPGIFGLGHLVKIWQLACKEVREENLYISAMAPTHLTSFQGEVRRGLWGLDLTCTFVKKPMREALAQNSQFFNGLKAITLMKTYMCERSYEWLQRLFTLYSDHVIEFSCYLKNWGTVPGFNTVFWEVRKY